MCVCVFGAACISAACIEHPQPTEKTPTANWQLHKNDFGILDKDKDLSIPYSNFRPLVVMRQISQQADRQTDKQGNELTTSISGNFILLMAGLAVAVAAVAAGSCPALKLAGSCLAATTPGLATLTLSWIVRHLIGRWVLAACK